MAELPPRIIAREARRRSVVAAGVTAPAPRPAGSLASAEDSNFPVLEAFHEYLNKERQKLRRRIWLTTSVLGLVIAGVSCLVYLQTKTIMGDLNSQIGQMAEEIGNTRAQTVADLTEQSSRMAKNEEAAQSLKQALIREQNTRIQQSKAIQSEFDTNSRLVDELNALVKTLTVENSALEGQLSDLSKIVPELAKNMQLLEGKISAVSMRHAFGGVPAGSLSAGPLHASMAILPPGQTEPIRWRLIIPE